MAGLKDRLAAAAVGIPSDHPLLAEVAERYAVIPIEHIEPDPTQPRKSIGDIEELRASIAEHGIIQAIVVSPHGESKFRIITGERRFSAARSLGLKTIPAIIRAVEDHRRLEVQLIENIHRQELSPVDEALAYQKLIDEFHLSQRDLAKRVAKSLPAINQTLRILTLPPEILAEVPRSEHLSRSVLLEMAKLDTVDEQIQVWKDSHDGPLTVLKLREKKKGKSRKTLNRTRLKYETTTAVVTIEFPKSEVSTNTVVEALQEAIALAQKAA